MFDAANAKMRKTMKATRSKIKNEIDDKRTMTHGVKKKKKKEDCPCGEDDGRGREERVLVLNECVFVNEYVLFVPVALLVYCLFCSSSLKLNPAALSSSGVSSTILCTDRMMDVRCFLCCVGAAAVTYPLSAVLFSWA